jgi:hypothetical protein
MRDFGLDKRFLKHWRTTVKVLRPTLDQLVKVRILLRQLFFPAQMVLLKFTRVGPGSLSYRGTSSFFAAQSRVVVRQYSSSVERISPCEP